MPSCVVNQLGAHMLGRAGDHEPRTIRGPPYLFAYAQLSALTCGLPARGLLTPFERDCHGLLTSLSGLAADVLIGIAHTLALIWFRLAQFPNIGRDLADYLLIDPLNRKFGLGFDVERDSLGRFKRHGMAVPQAQFDGARALGNDPVPDADDFHLLFKTLRDPVDHIAH